MVDDGILVEVKGVAVGGVSGNPRSGAAGAGAAGGSRESSLGRGEAAERADGAASSRSSKGSWKLSPVALFARGPFEIEDAAGLLHR